MLHMHRSVNRKKTNELNVNRLFHPQKIPTATKGEIFPTHLNHPQFT